MLWRLWHRERKPVLLLTWCWQASCRACPGHCLLSVPLRENRLPAPQQGPSHVVGDSPLGSEGASLRIGLLTC